MQRFRETVKIQQEDFRSGQAGVSLTLADKLNQFKNQQFAKLEQSAVSRGTSRAKQQELQKVGGITQKPKHEKGGIFGFIGSVERQAHNKALYNAYVASLDTDIKSNISRIEADNPDNIISFNDSLESFKQSTIQSVDPSFRQQAELLINERGSISGSRVYSKNRQRDKDNAFSELQVSEKTLLDDALTLARDQNIENAVISLSDYEKNINSQVESGFITPFQANSKIDTARALVADQDMVGQLRSTLNKGDFEGALKSIQKVINNPAKWRTPQEQQTLEKSLLSEINESLNISNRIEYEENKKIDIAQSNNFSDYLQRIVLPSIDQKSIAAQDIIKGLKLKEITETQANNLLNTLNNRGLGVDDYSVINNFNAEIESIATEKDLENFISDVSKQIGTRLTGETGNSLMQKARDVLSKESVLYTGKAKRYRQFIEKSMGLTGPLATLEPDQSRILAEKIRIYDERILAGGDPAIEADDLIGRYDYERMSNPMYGTKENLDDSLKMLNEAFDSGNIDDDTYDYEYNNLKKLKILKSNIEQYDKAKNE